MANAEVAAWAATLGAIGSLAYLTAMYFTYVGTSELLGRFWAPAGGLGNPMRVVWFGLVGAGVAFVFQLPETTLAPIQAFIVGTTWPTIVSQVLTGRQGESPKDIKDQILSLLGTPRGGYRCQQRE